MVEVAERTKMKFVLFILLAIFAMPMAMAITPAEVNSFTADLTLPDVVNPQNNMTPENVVMWDDYIAFWGAYSYIDSFNSRAKVRIYNYQTGSLVYENDFDEDIGCGLAQGEGVFKPHFFANNLYLPWAAFCGGTNKGYTIVLDVSNPAFISVEANTAYGKDVDGVQWTVLDEDVNEFLFSDGIQTYFINATGGIEDRSNLPFATNYILQSSDEDNRVLVTSDTFYSYDINDPNATTNLGSVDPGRGSIIDFNFQRLNPEYITDQGHIVITGGGDYDNIQTSSAAVSFTPIFYFERGNIVGLNEINAWITSNASDLSAVTTINTSEPVPYSNTELARSIDRIAGTNVTNGNITIYSVPTPEGTFLAQETNTAPTQEVSFLGVDIDDQFIFSNTISDAEGGNVFLAQKVLPSYADINELVVERIIDFNSEEDLILMDSNSFWNFVGVFEKSGVNLWANSNSTFMDTGYNEIFIFDDQSVLSLPESPLGSETPAITVNSAFWFGDPANIFDSEISYTIRDQSGREVLDILFERAQPANTVNLYELDGLSRNLIATYNLSRLEDVYSVLANIYFTNSTVDLIVTSESGIHYIDNIPFDDPAAIGVDDVVYHQQGTASLLPVQVLYVDYVTLSYTLSAPDLPDYELYDTLQPGEVEVEPSALGGNLGFGNYILYSYVTDDTIGTDNYDNELTLSFTYDNETEELDQQEINALISAQETTVGDLEGFQEVLLVEGDVISDFLGTFEEAGFLTPASKFFLGLVFVVFIMATMAQMGSMGLIFGAIIGVIFTTFIGLFPLWVTVVVIIVAVAVFANMARSMLGGQ